MLVVFCQSQRKTGKFVSGWSNFRINAIQAYEVLKQYKAATKVVEQPEVKKYEGAWCVHMKKVHERLWRMNRFK